MGTETKREAELNGCKPFGAAIVRPYNVVCMDSAASPLERETALLIEWNKSLAENSRLNFENARMREALEKIERHGPIMGSTGEYRQGQLDILEVVSTIAGLCLSNAASEGQPGKGASHVE